MGLFDLLKNETDDIRDIIRKGYHPKYFNECKRLWKSSVPKSGQAKSLQGELLREIEKLRHEAQDNGNINWDEDYSYFCDFIVSSLSAQSIFSKREKAEIRAVMAYIKECGLYARRCACGEIKDCDIDPNKIAYTEDNLYDIICDKIGELQKECPAPIPYEPNLAIQR